MADEDEIDILGDFSFNSCFAQNNQGIPSCSTREDTVHPQWLLDATETNWYDKQSNRLKEGSPKKLYGNNSSEKYSNDLSTTENTWSQAERQVLHKEMAKYGRNVRKISQTLKSKTEAEIQALIEAEFGVNLDTPTISFGVYKSEELDEIPAVGQEEIVTVEATGINNVLNMVTTGTPTVKLPNKPFRKKTNKSNMVLNHNIIYQTKPELIAVNPSEILYDDELIVGSTESIGNDSDLNEMVSKNILKYQGKVKAEKKIGNHRRKVSRNYDKGKNKSKDIMKSPQERRRKDSGLSDDNAKSTNLHIVLGSGQALPVSEGEQVIKIEKKKDSEPDSDIEIDVDSDQDSVSNKGSPQKLASCDRGAGGETAVAVPLGDFTPMPKRPKKINLDGDGGYTIMHTSGGDLLARGQEPRKERPVRKQAQAVHLLHCRMYNADKPAPFSVLVHVSTLLLMDAHAHASRAEVMGLLGGHVRPGDVTAGDVTRPVVTLCAYRPAAAAAGSTHCDMDPVSQSRAAESLRAQHVVCGWHHSHPQFPAAPSAQDLRSQAGLQQALEWKVPFLGFITSQHWPTGRTASQYRCIRVEDTESDIPVGYQFSVRLVPDITPTSLPTFAEELRSVMVEHVARDQFSVDLLKHVCPQARLTYIDKLISSASHHLHSAGYADSEPLVQDVLTAIRDVLR